MENSQNDETVHMQVLRGGDAELRYSSASTVPCVLGPAAEAEVREGSGGTPVDWERGGRASTREDVRRTLSLPQVHETGRQPFQGRREDWRVELLARSRPLAGAWDFKIHGWSWIGMSPEFYCIPSIVMSSSIKRLKRIFILMMKWINDRGRRGQEGAGRSKPRIYSWVRQWNVWSTYVQKGVQVLVRMTRSPPRRKAPVASSLRVRVSRSWFGTLLRVRGELMVGAWDVSGCGSFYDCTRQYATSLILAEFLFAGN